MNHMKRKNLLRCCVSSLTVLCATAIPLCLSSCGEDGSKQAQALPMSYPVMTVDTATVTVYVDFATELESDIVVEIRPRVSGYIDNISVNEGSLVKKHQELFLINQDALRADLKSATASVNMAEASVGNAELEVRKLTPLVEKNIISHFELENANSNLKAAKAQLEYAESQQENAEINMDFSRILSPVDGVVGRINVRKGSLVGSSDMSPLTTVSGDGDMSAYFSVDERSLQNITREMHGLTLDEKVENLPRLQLIMADGSIYGHSGRPEIASGLVDVTTGSIQLKAMFPNPKGELRTGSSGVVRIPSTITEVVLVPQKVTFELQDRRMVYIIDADGVIQSRTITTSGESGPFFVVSDGLKFGDKIIYEGVSKVRENQTITPEILNTDSLYNALQTLSKTPLTM